MYTVNDSILTDYLYFYDELFLLPYFLNLIYSQDVHFFKKIEKLNGKKIFAENWDQKFWMGKKVTSLSHSLGIGGIELFASLCEHPTYMYQRVCITLAAGTWRLIACYRPYNTLSDRLISCYGTEYHLCKKTKHVYVNMHIYIYNIYTHTLDTDSCYVQ